MEYILAAAMAFCFLFVLAIELLFKLGCWILLKLIHLYWWIISFRREFK